MIRFRPDTWWEAAMRPFAMAAPDANIYVEIAAPDVRFAVALFLALAALLWWRRVRWQAAVPILFGLAALAFIPWLITSGNGRYFVPILLIVGPLVGGIIHLLPLTKSFRLFLMGGTFVVQTAVLALNPPWGAWAWLNWEQAPYFHVAMSKFAAERSVTYITVSSISYSLIAPQFPADARWINISSGGATPRDNDWVRRFVANSGRRILVVPSVSEQTLQGQPTAEVRQALDDLLGPHGLALRPSQPCEVLPSRGLAAITTRYSKAELTAQTGKFSFWLCPLQYPVDYRPAQDGPVSVRVESVFAKLEQTCPRFFRPGEAVTRRIKDGGALRQYPGSDMNLYVLADGTVLYKFWRALNPVLIGRIDEILTGSATVQCDNIRGRAGLPWDREI